MTQARQRANVADKEPGVTEARSFIDFSNDRSIASPSTSLRCEGGITMRLGTTLLLFSLLLVFARSGHAFTTRSPGGSTYAWYDLDAPYQPAPTTGQNCRERYGILANYNASGVRQIVQRQLAEMRASGQDRMRIPIFHGHNISTGTVVNSAGGNLGSTHRQNLSNFLADVRSASFREIMVSFHPVGNYNTPTSWSSWNEQAFQENWNLIYNLRPIIARSGIHYRIDLMNEGAPTTGQTQQREYVRRLWGNYNYVFGKSDTLGFSIIGDTPERYRVMRDVMMSTGYGTPYLYSVHFYENAIAGNSILAMHNEMNRRGDGQTGWIIGEVLYNDQITLNKLLSTNLGSRPVFFVLQWPVSRGRGCDGHADVAPPTDFSVYSQLY